MKFVRQFSVDILDDDVDEDQIADALENAGIICLGSGWKATWTKEDYEKGKPPISSD